MIGNQPSAGNPIILSEHSVITASSSSSTFPMMHRPPVKGRSKEQVTKMSMSSSLGLGSRVIGGSELEAQCSTGLRSCRDTSKGQIDGR